MANRGESLGLEISTQLSTQLTHRIYWARGKHAPLPLMSRIGRTSNLTALSDLSDP